MIFGNWKEASEMFNVMRNILLFNFKVWFYMMLDYNFYVCLSDYLNLVPGFLMSLTHMYPWRYDVVHMKHTFTSF